MNLASGMRLGHYELLGLLGAGGMGEVYRARDARLDREVAVKILPSAGRNGDLLRRFEQEAKALGALAHPNIVSVHDVGEHEGTPYIVSELLEGESLRERLQAGALPTRKAIDYAVQIARALAAAHDKGIVHRDVKPENLFITRDGRIKVLDFGIAKLTDSRPADGAAPTSPGNTRPGAILGTVGYMSPEQVRGAAVDHRSDIFSLGSILYEMLTGTRAFEGESHVDTAYAILNEDPPALAESGRPFPLALEKIVMRCIEKQPDERFQSALDLAFDLEALSGLSDSTGTTLIARPARDWRRLALMIGAPLLAGLLAGGAYLLGNRGPGAPDRPGMVVADDLITPHINNEPPSYQQLTFRRGPILTARFAPEASTVVLSAEWDGERLDVYTTMPGGAPDSRSLGLPGADLAAVSSKGELALLLDAKLDHFNRTGTLARMPLTGGAARQMLEQVQWADWHPDGEQLAIVRGVEHESRLELPPGTVLYTSKGWLSHLRVSPDGSRVAFLEHPMYGDDQGQVVVVGLKGTAQPLTDRYASAQGLAWSPDGSEVWFTAADVGLSRALRGVTLDGKVRLINRVPGTLTLHDVSRNGRVLMTVDEGVMGVMGMAPSATKERELSWYDWSLLADLSRDGSTILINESGDGGGVGYGLYLRKTDGSPAVRLGNGYLPAQLSPDGKWVLGIEGFQRDQLTLLPTGAGERRTVKVAAFDDLDKFAWVSADQVLVQGRGDDRIHLVSLATGAARPVGPSGVSLSGMKAAAPDGSAFLGYDQKAKKRRLFPIEAGEVRDLPLEDREVVLGWNDDGTALYLLRYGEGPPQMLRFDLASGERTTLRAMVPPERTGTVSLKSTYVTPDGAGYAYSYIRMLSDLYLVGGIG